MPITNETLAPRPPSTRGSRSTRYFGSWCGRVVFTGPRAGEGLGLTWGADFEARLVRIHRQLSRYREHAKLKIDAGRREVVLGPAVVRLLRARWPESPGKGPDDFVFTTGGGRPLDYRHVGEAFRTAVQRSGVRADGRLSLHSLRHGYASLLIADGLDIVFVSRQLGHADPGVMLSVYAHLFARAKHALAARSAIEASYAATCSGGRSRAGPPFENGKNPGGGATGVRSLHRYRGPEGTTGLRSRISRTPPPGMLSS